MARALLNAAPIFLAATLCGCLVYPRLYWKTERGHLDIQNGKPAFVKGQILKECDGLSRVSVTVEDEKTAKPDDKGRYDFTLRALVWDLRDFLTRSECSSRVQLYICRPDCKPVDPVELDILGR